MVMTVMQFGEVRVIMGKWQVSMRVRMRFLDDRLSIVRVIVMPFVPMNVVVYYLLMRMGMRVMCAEE